RALRESLFIPCFTHISAECPGHNSVAPDVGAKRVSHTDRQRIQARFSRCIGQYMWFRVNRSCTGDINDGPTFTSRHPGANQGSQAEGSLEIDVKDLVKEFLAHCIDRIIKG